MIFNFKDSKNIQKAGMIILILVLAFVSVGVTSSANAKYQASQLSDEEELKAVIDAYFEL
jgi:hypothetical protein